MAVGDPFVPASAFTRAWRGAEMTAAVVSRLVAGEETDYLINPGYRLRKAAVS